MPRGGKPFTPEQRIQSVWAKIKKGREDECWEWQASCNPAGYGYCWNRNNRRMCLAHREVWESLHGPIGNPKILVLHSCDNPPCCNPAHLSLGDHKENRRQMVARHRGPDVSGEKNPKAKLTDQQVAEIRDSFTGKHGEKMRIARQYGISSSHVSKLIYRQNR